MKPISMPRICWVMFPALLVVLACLLICSRATAQSASEIRTNIGYPRQILQRVIAGSPVSAKAVDDRDQPVMVRILATYPHGTDNRYDIEFCILDPGEFDLAEYLQRVDSTDTQPIDPIPVVIESLLADGQVEPAAIAPQRSRFYSFYGLLIVIAIFIWLIGLLFVLFYGRPKKVRTAAEIEPPSVAERLQPLVAAAMAGNISTEQQAELERLLASYWSQKMSWQELSAVQIRQRLREHPEASQLLNQIDLWLHRPKSTVGATDVDIAKLLQPYRQG